MIPLLWTALACTTGTEPGTLAATANAVACLAVEGTVLPGDDGAPGPHVIDVDATTIAETDPAGQDWAWGVRCDQAVRVLTLQDAGGGLWHVGWAWGEGGFDRTPATTLGPNEQVHLRFRAVTDFEQSAGFVVTDEADRVVAAIEVGTWGPALHDGDVPGLSVRDGIITGSEQDECGLKEARQLLFDGGAEEITLESIDLAPLNIAGEQTTAWALANYGWRDATCPDIAGERSWSVFR